MSQSLPEAAGEIKIRIDPILLTGSASDLRACSARSAIGSNNSHPQNRHIDACSSRAAAGVRGSWRLR
jgi:hypothetical protein